MSHSQIRGQSFHRHSWLPPLPETQSILGPNLHHHHEPQRQPSTTKSPLAAVPFDDGSTTAKRFESVVRIWLSSTPANVRPKGAVSRTTDPKSALLGSTLSFEALSARSALLACTVTRTMRPSCNTMTLTGWHLAVKLDSSAGTLALYCPLPARWSERNTFFFG